MTGGLQGFAYRWWDGQLGLRGVALTILLTPASVAWRWLARRRERRYAGGAAVRVRGLAVVSVGNLAVGGTGKTPFSSWVARSLAESGAKPGLALNGYGHDEEMLHRAWTPGIPVESDRERVAAARRIAERGCDVAVLDDGFQHQRLGRDLDIVLIGVEDRFPGRVLPCGPYRESESALARADVVVFTRRWAPAGVVPALEAAVRAVPGVGTDLVTACLRLAPNGVVALSAWAGGGASGQIRSPGTQPIDGAAAPAIESTGVLRAPGTESPGVLRAPATLAQVADLGPPVVFTAIARPSALLAEVKVVSLQADLIAFEDHHDFTERDVLRARKRAGSRPLVITEKDAVKLRVFASLLPNTWVLTQTIDWDWGEDGVRAALTRTGPR